MSNIPRVGAIPEGFAAYGSDGDYFGPEIAPKSDETLGSLALKEAVLENDTTDITEEI